MTTHAMPAALLARAAVAVVALGVAVPVGGQSTGSQPNVVFILADDLGWGDLGCFGNTRLLTPRLDQLAAGGTRFTHFYAASPVCSPTRAALLTGRFPSELAIHTAISCSSEVNAGRAVPDWLDPSTPTVTGLFQAAGYSVGLFGKWHLGCVPGAPDPGAYGIDDHVSIMSTGPQFAGVGQEFWWANSTEQMVDEAIDFIDVSAGTPFFLILAPVLPHSTLNPTPEQLAVYSELTPGPGHGGEPMSWTGAWQIYYASVTAMDEQIGRLLDHINQLGLTGDTLVIFTSDNGPAGPYTRTSSHSGVGTGGPFRGNKWSLFEAGIRMPLIIRWPGQVAAGAVDNESVIGMVDFLPTLCSLAGIPPCVSPPSDDNWSQNPSVVVKPQGVYMAMRREPPGLGFEVDGEDVSGMILGAPGSRTQPLLWEYRFTQKDNDYLHRSPLLAIRKDNWKLLLNPDLSRVELYDVVADTWELHNRADDYPDIVAELSVAALEWQASLPPGPYFSQAGDNTYPWPQP